MSQGLKFRKAIEQEKPLQIVGAINAYSAMLARDSGFKAIYLSGAGVANASLGLPDLGMTNLADVLEDARRITAAVDIPLLVDIDVGWGSAFNIARTIKEMERAGVAAVHIEDQVLAKRCGHRPGKALVSKAEMCERINAAVDARKDPNFVIMARTDALAVEGLEASIERSCAYVEAGADMIFAEALQDIEEYQHFISSVKVPTLANLTEFGKTPYYTVTELAAVGLAMTLYPLSAFRAMNQATLNVYTAIKEYGTQASVLDTMQTREQLYDHLHYHEYEDKLDSIQKSEGKA